MSVPGPPNIRATVFARTPRVPMNANVLQGTRTMVIQNIV